MHLYPKTLLTAAILLVASCSIGQERYRSPDPDLKARLSYDNSGVVVGPGTVRHVCVAVSWDGDYRIERSLNDGQTQRLHGKMPKEEFRQLNKLLEAAEFRSLSGDHGGLIRQESERFAAEIPFGDRWREDGARKWLEHDAWRLQWLNADGESPFPASVSTVVDWLKRFQPKDGKSFEYAEYPDVCPTGGLRLLQPAVAQNSHP
jgi:hypothetical protein